MIELIFICMCICNGHTLVNDQDSTWMAQVSGLKKELLPSLPKAQLTHRSSSGVYQPQLQPQPVSSAASTSCLQEGPAATPFFHFLWCSWCFREADYSRPVAMADCCCCPSPCWPHKIVQQSTGLLKPLIGCMVPKLQVGNRVCATLDTANQNCAAADSLLRLQVDSRVRTVHCNAQCALTRSLSSYW